MSDYSIYPSIENIILHEDSDLIAVNKPAGLLTIQDGYDKSKPNLFSLLTEKRGRVWTIHRLDKDTSGIVFFAKNPQAHKLLSLQFEHRMVQKEYHLVIQGIPKWNTIEVNQPLQINGDRKHRTIVNFEIGKSALTTFEVIKKFSGFTLVKAFPKTGYTHQIRSHITFIGFPIIGDLLYGYHSMISIHNSALDFENFLFLHAFKLECIHPTSKNKLYLQAPYPAHFQIILSL